MKSDLKIKTVIRIKELSWAQKLAIFSRSKSVEEREFYLQLAKRENFTFSELDRQISACLFERTLKERTKLSAVCEN
jgi:predicted nuclease of restriction endonuclease-like (RecB) superfamily